MPVTIAKLLQVNSATDVPSKAALEQLVEVLAYNDSVTPGCGKRKIRIQDVSDMMNSYKFSCGYKKLQRVCRQLGRRSFESA